MESIEEAQREIVNEFNAFDDAFDQYAMLIELAGMFEPMPEEDKTEDMLVAGCQSKAWVDVSTEGGVFSFRGDSNTFIIKGMLKVLQDLLDGRSVEEVADARIDFLQKTKIPETFDDARNKGIGHIIATLQGAARKACE